MDLRQTVEIRVRGTVQGVGFRPAVWRLARAEGLVGEVFNDGLGVLIRATGAPAAVARVLDRLRADPPPLARIEDVQTCPLARVVEFDDFRIVESPAGENRTRVAPDAATCPACRAEVLDPADRRFGYPFANCTHCGPRFSIVTRVPYDRANTTMAAFPMCPACAAEYGDPADRRFHAQPVACPACGPAVWLESPGEPDAATRPAGAAALRAAVALLLSGAVVAVRGLGGFHLACLATDPAAVARLRARKRRYGKPFALMAADLDAVRRYCRVTPAEAGLLLGPAAPVVLLPAAGPEVLPAAVAPGLDTLGFMLPYTPLHLLLARGAGRPLVMTSGNVSHEPQVTGLDEARSRLRDVADAFLMHDREIANRVDDSVVRVVASRPQVIRRARGYAPAAVSLPPGFEAAPDLLAYGGELKAAFCLVKDGAAVLSQHQGDLEDAATFDDYRKNLDLYARAYDHRPGLLAADLHPEYLSAKLARRRAADDGLALREVQHHHAHVASCMAEHGLPLDAAPVLGVALDGLGYGDDGTLWGGEVLLADYRGYRRLAALAAVPMPGGAQAVREPWRNTYAHLAAGPGWARVAARFSALPLYRHLTAKPLAVIDRMTERGLNAPPASSCGRLFDAVAAALGLCADHALFEGQGAMELEAAAARCRTAADEPAYPFALRESAGGLLRIDPAPMWEALLADLDREVSVERVAARFHLGLAAAVGDTVARVRRGSPAADTVALSGGCFQNKPLTEAVVRRLAADGLRCLTHAAVPANDGGLALGQAVVAAARELGPRPAAPMRRSTACV